MKIVRITCCFECPDACYDLDSDKCYCGRDDIPESAEEEEVSGIIPNWCPLEDAEKKKKEREDVRR